jgi:mannose-6-phosphate isomerase
MDPEGILGRRVAEKFFRRLPFLFKVLAAEKPLSIQVHPNVAQAREGFAKENDHHIPFDAPNRNYKDENHKPEILCALTPFECLKGFRNVHEIIHFLEKLPSSLFSDELGLLKEKPDTVGLKKFFSKIMMLERERQNYLVSETVRFSRAYAKKDQVFYWIANLNRVYPGDIGVLAPAILNLLTLNPGEAIYVSAGTPHTYLHGVGVELMANSDNVLRGGLTPKYIDVPELLRITDFKVETSHKTMSVIDDTGLKLFRTPAEEFLLSAIALDRGGEFTSPQGRNVEILICVEGQATIEDLGAGHRLFLSRGSSVVIPAAVPQYRIEGRATIYKASVPA